MCDAEGGYRKKKKRNPTAKFSNDQEAPFRAHSRAKLDHSEELGAKCDAEKRGVRRSGVVYPDGYVKHRVCVCVSSRCDTNRLSLLRTVTFRRDALAPVAQRGRFASSPTHTLSAYKRDFLPHPCFVSGTFFPRRLHRLEPVTNAAAVVSGAAAATTSSRMLTCGSRSVSNPEMRRHPRRDVTSGSRWPGRDPSIAMTDVSYTEVTWVGTR